MLINFIACIFFPDQNVPTFACLFCNADGRQLPTMRYIVDIIRSYRIIYLVSIIVPLPAKNFEERVLLCMSLSIPLQAIGPDGKIKWILLWRGKQLTIKWNYFSETLNVPQKDEFYYKNGYIKVPFLLGILEKKNNQLVLKLKSCHYWIWPAC